MSKAFGNTIELFVDENAAQEIDGNQNG